MCKVEGVACSVLFRLLLHKLKHMPADIVLRFPLPFFFSIRQKEKWWNMNQTSLPSLPTLIEHKSAWNGHMLRCYHKAVSHSLGLTRPQWHISSAYPSLKICTTPANDSTTQAVQEFSRETGKKETPHRTTSLFNHSGPLTQHTSRLQSWVCLLCWWSLLCRG